ncbi:MAG TPA: carboxypeptidase-like regulatory domain-containing protein [Polyangia bacterium]|nr:carboxypeptidase-like regulatory domain-containing protein [Polyangia bacterium]
MGATGRLPSTIAALGVAVLLPAVARATSEAPESVAVSAAPVESDEDQPPLTAHAPGEPVAVGRVVDAGPGPRSLSLLSAAGFGYTGSVLGAGDSHDRLAGRLMVDGRVLPWLALTLTLDGRYDHHDVPGQATQSGYVGDPRVSARADRRLNADFRIGARFGLWLPGADAPSLPLDAASPELALLATYAPPKLPLAISVNAGYRLDRSAHTAENAAALSPSDRLALGVSDFDAVLLGAGASIGHGKVQGYLEGSWELLVGSRAPGALASPIYLGAGARAVIAPQLRAEAGIEVSPSERPDLSASAPLVVVPPRVAGWLGLSYRFGPEAHRPSRPPPAPPPPEPPPPELSSHEEADPPAVPGPGSQLRGLVRSLHHGDVVAADIEIKPVGDGAGGDDATRRIRATGGQFQLDVPPGEYEVGITAPGFEPQRRRVRVEDNGVTLLDIDLKVAR